MSPRSPSHHVKTQGPKTAQTCGPTSSFFNPSEMLLNKTKKEGEEEEEKRVGRRSRTGEGGLGTTLTQQQQRMEPLGAGPAAKWACPSLVPATPPPAVGSTGDSAPTRSLPSPLYGVCRCHIIPTRMGSGRKAERVAQGSGAQHTRWGGSGAG